MIRKTLKKYVWANLRLVEWKKKQIEKDLNLKIKEKTKRGKIKTKKVNDIYLHTTSNNLMFFIKGIWRQ